MAVTYGVVKGTVVQTGRNENTPGSSNHFHIIVQAAGQKWRCPVNIQSADKSEVWFKIEQPLTSAAILAAIQQLPDGLKKLPDRVSGLTLDFIREPLFDRKQMTHLPFKANGPQDDIQDFLAVYADRAMSEAGSVIYVFGSWWENQKFPPDDFFGTDQGVHDIHMNQGNDAGHVNDDGIFQDGALVFHFPSIGWVGFFCAFNSQVWFTDEKGHRRPGFAEGPLASDEPGSQEPQGDASIAIIAALLNPEGEDPGKETVTIFNTTPADAPLDGYRLVDKNGKGEPLVGVLPTNQALTVTLSGNGAQLGNKGGSIQLQRPDGAVVHAVTYSASQAKSGVIVLF